MDEAEELKKRVDVKENDAPDLTDNPSEMEADNTDENDNIPDDKTSGENGSSMTGETQMVSRVQWKRRKKDTKKMFRCHTFDEEDGKNSSDCETESKDGNSGMDTFTRDDTESKVDLQVEEMENCNIADKKFSKERDVLDKSTASKLKRSNCKSQEKVIPSLEHKKRKKIELISSKVETSDVVSEENEKSVSDDADSVEISSESTDTSSSSSSDSEEEEKEEKDLTDDEIWLEKHTSHLKFPSWRTLEELRKREYGNAICFWPYKVCGSLAMVQRFERQFTLDAHEGCVNALHFNQAGNFLASGSDDLDIHIWDWSVSSKEPFISYNSGHRSNVFQAKFMPNCNDSTVVSCARDGQVRVGYLSSTGTCRDTKKVGQHRGSAHKLALDSSGCRATFLSCGEDSVVMRLDLRESKPSKKLLTVKEGSNKIALYSIDTNPSRPNEFAVSGRDQWARTFDRRMLDAEKPEILEKFCPSHLEKASESSMKANITCLVYNYDGSELLCSYNDEDIYLFDISHSSGDDFTRKYKGHRNNATVKGVNFYGPKSEFVVSGSDCGNIFLWEKSSSKVIQYMEGDEGGVVNVLEPHPNLPLLATSGLDKNIKIWGPTGDGNLKKDKLRELMLSNRRERHEENSNPPQIDSHLLWFLMRSLRNASDRARMRRSGQDDDEDESTTSSSNSSSDSDEDGARTRQIDCLTS